jgi:stage V sporulation protein AE
MKRKVIIVTDGDDNALKTVEYAAHQIGGRCISHSHGNPTKLNGEELVQLVKETPYDPVFIMFDDSGLRGIGPGERAMLEVASHSDIDVLGIIAVASNTRFTEWAKVDVSVDRFGNLTHYGIDKRGFPDLEVGRINGDTVYCLDRMNVPVIVGIGDIGKMAGVDAIEAGAPITMKAIEIILERSGYDGSKRKDTNF